MMHERTNMKKQLHAENFFFFAKRAMQSNTHFSSSQAAVKSVDIASGGMHNVGNSVVRFPGRDSTARCPENNISWHKQDTKTLLLFVRYLVNQYADI